MTRSAFSYGSSVVVVLDELDVERLTVVLVDWLTVVEVDCETVVEELVDWLTVVLVDCETVVEVDCVVLVL